MGPNLGAGQRGFPDLPLMLGGRVEAHSDLPSSQAPPQLRQECGGHLLRPPGTQPGADTPQWPDDRPIEHHLGRLSRGGWVDRCGVSAQAPPQPGQDILPTLALVPLDGAPAGLALLRPLLQRLGERPLGRWRSPGAARARPMAPEAQPGPITPSGRGGDGCTKGTRDEGRDALPRPGAGLPPALAWGALATRLQRRPLGGGQPGARASGAAGRPAHRR
jgi:hypothetical protein